MQIATLNVHGPAQVGNGNIQNIENVFNQLIKGIDESSATDEEKMRPRVASLSFLIIRLLALL
ncbi:Uncharacterised protein [Serratia proteamaculans]|uniref:hypothetical protein n=1 Tax=Serratia proteamaculans TaxID=28151 RepID=UPI00217A53CD|nr:hypothetical protein [Serratia proteamaculans]CAI1818986.1 Uncharacterised protein [Serratia proteamaculans]